MTQINAAAFDMCQSLSSEARRNNREEISVTNSFTKRNVAVASAFGALTALMMFGTTGQVSAAASTSVANCQGSTRSSVMACCEEQVKRHGLPLWMRQAHTHCTDPKMYKCGSTIGAANQVCKVVVITDDKGDKDKGNKKK